MTERSSSLGEGEWRPDGRRSDWTDADDSTSASNEYMERTFSSEPIVLNEQQTVALLELMHERGLDETSMPLESE